MDTVTIQQAVIMTGKSEKTLYRYMQKNLLPYTQKGRQRMVLESDLLTLFQKENQIIIDCQKCHSLSDKVTIIESELAHITEKEKQLTDRIIILESLLSSLCQKMTVNTKTERKKEDHSTKQAVKKSAKISNYNKDRSNKAITVGQEVYQSLDNPTKQQVTEKSGLSRTTIAKYWKEISAI